MQSFLITHAKTKHLLPFHGKGELSPIKHTIDATFSLNISDKMWALTLVAIVII